MTTNPTPDAVLQKIKKLTDMTIQIGDRDDERGLRGIARSPEIEALRSQFHAAVDAVPTPDDGQYTHDDLTGMDKAIKIAGELLKAYDR